MVKYVLVDKFILHSFQRSSKQLKANGVTLTTLPGLLKPKPKTYCQFKSCWLIEMKYRVIKRDSVL